MPINGYSTGRDYTVDIISPAGPLRFSAVISFNSKQKLDDKEIVKMNGQIDHARFFKGWMGEFEIDRQDANVDKYFAQLEANYYQGLNEQSCTMTVTVSEPDGSVSQFRFVGVLFKLEDAGTWKGNDTVKQKVSFVASQRQQIS